MRRWSVQLVIAFCLLVGAASPAFACAAAAKGGDCCPQGSTSPCGEEGQQDLASLAACCVTAPPAPSAVLVEVNRNTPAQPHDSGPDPILALAWFATLSPRVRAPQTVALSMCLPRTDAALTYLRTRRLRL